jgi:hypothetical protein
VRVTSKCSNGREEGKDTHRELLVAKVITSSFELTNMVRITYNMNPTLDKISIETQCKIMGTRFNEMIDEILDGWM